ncbi:MAG: Do family serine endopeptidase [Gammaproteobacteria bacterium]|nr:Do family serine endopeptidase [Gammaproteobacteria bacterium]MCP5201453.1 Do family serine endopeptidase [Gammaproteobacteria bacterium]
MKSSLHAVARLGAVLLLSCVFGSTAAVAALPAIVDGQPLPSLAPMLDQVTPAVVNIATEGHVELRTNPLFNDPFFRRFFNFPERPLRRKTQSLGSGVIVDAARGLILTNNHVIANADAITVNLRDGRDFAAELVGSDPDTDVAVIRIAPERLTAVKLADSDALRVGDFVVAIGNPFGLGQTVTSGIISALARSGLGITGYEDLIQTDASINPGNSGGALVNLRGELVGINTAIYSQSGGNIGIGFAIPANMAHDVMEQLVSFGEVRRGFLGTQFQDLDAELAEAFGLPVSEGAVLASVAPGSPAAAAGLHPGDVIVEFNGRKVGSAADLRNQIGLARVGARVEVVFVREGRRQRAQVEIGARDELAGREVGFRNERLANVTVGDIPENSPAYGRIAGVMIHGVEPGSRAWAAGLRKGDIISSVNRVPTPSVAAFVQVVDGIQGQLLLSVHRGTQAAYVVIK